MTKQKDIKNLLKKHKEAFGKTSRDIYLPDEEIPPLPQWFLELKKQRKKKKMRFILPAVVAAVTVAVFLTPMGGIFAENISRTLYSISGTSLHIQHGKEAEENTPHPKQAKFASATEVAEQYGILVAHNPNFDLLDEIKVEKSEGMLLVHSIYEVNKTPLILEQIIYEGLFGSGFTLDSKGTPIKTTMQGGVEVTGYKEYKNLYAMGFYENNSISFTAQGLSEEAFQRFVEGTTF